MTLTEAMRLLKAAHRNRREGNIEDLQTVIELAEAVIEAAKEQQKYIKEGDTTP